MRHWSGGEGKLIHLQLKNVDSSRATGTLGLE